LPNHGMAGIRFANRFQPRAGSPSVSERAQCRGWVASLRLHGSIETTDRTIEFAATPGAIRWMRRAFRGAEAED
jgi:hypothetical protein